MATAHDEHSSSSSLEEEEYDFDKREASPQRPSSPLNSDDESSSSSEESEEANNELESLQPRTVSEVRPAAIVGNDILPPLINRECGNQCQDCGRKFSSFEEAMLHECEGQRLAKQQLLASAASSAIRENIKTLVNEELEKAVYKLSPVKSKSKPTLAPGEKPCKRKTCGRKVYKKGLCKYHYYKWYYAHPGAVKPRQRSRPKKVATHA